MAIWKLTIEDDEGQKTVVPLVRDEYTIGRRDGHTIRLTERNVSRDHAKIRRENDGYVLEDLGSYNGVFVNGHRVADPQRLNPGDLVLIGDYRIEAHNEDAAARAIPIPGAPAVPGAAAIKQGSTPPVSVRPAKTDQPHRLVLLTGTEGGREFPLDKERMILGRGDDVDIRVNHSSVSRHHCEVVVIDEGHFEVLDRGSANGIRVNGQDVKKAFLAPGDTIELGDVHLRYVAAGQPFVFDPALAEAAALESRGRKKSGAATWVILIALVSGAAAGGVLLARRTADGETNGSNGHPTTPSTGTTTATTATEDILAKAVKTKEDGDPIAAHALVAGIGKDSPLRKDPRYVEVENAWADKTVKGLDAEPDVEKKKAALTEILDSGADQSYRTHAADLLAALDKKASPPPDAKTPSTAEPTTHPPPSVTTATTTTAPTVKPTATATATTPPTATTTKPTATATATTPTTKPTATATTPPAATGTVGNCPSWKGAYDAAMRAKDYECVRTMLLPRLNSGSISAPEARYLKAACAALGDTACQKRAAEKM